MQCPMPDTGTRNFPCSFQRSVIGLVEIKVHALHEHTQLRTQSPEQNYVFPKTASKMLTKDQVDGKTQHQFESMTGSHAPDWYSTNRKFAWNPCWMAGTIQFLSSGK